jgi:F0F1-type ATP synthase assembly protein I
MIDRELSEQSVPLDSGPGELYFDSVLRPHAAHHLWEHLDRLGKYLDTIDSPRERYRFFPKLNHELSESFAHGNYTVEQISRFVELYYLKMDQFEKKDWTPSLLIVPEASYRQGELVVEFRILFDRSLSRHSMTVLQPYIDMCCEESHDAVLQWLIERADSTPLVCDPESTLPDNRATGAGFRIRRNEFLEDELRYHLFEKPLQAESIAFNRDHARRYIIPRVIERLITLLKDEERNHSVIEYNRIDHTRSKPLFLADLSPAGHILLTPTFYRNRPGGDICRHLISQTLALMDNLEGPLSEEHPRACGEILESSPERGSLAGENILDLPGLINGLLTSVEDLLVKGKENVTDPLLADTANQVRLIRGLLDILENERATRCRLFIHLREEEIALQIIRATGDLVACSPPLFPLEEWWDHDRLEEGTPGIIERLKNRKGFVHWHHEGTDYFAMEENLFRIYSSLKGSEHGLRREITRKMLGELSNRKDKDVNTLMDEMSYSNREQETFRRELSRQSRKQRISDEESQRMHQTLATLLLGLVTGLLAAVLLVVLTPLAIPWIVIISLFMGFLASLTVRRQVFPGNVQEEYLKEKDNQPARKAEEELKPETGRLAREMLPHEAVRGETVIRNLKDSEKLEETFPRQNKEEPEEWAGRLLSLLVRKGEIIELPISRDLKYYVFPERWGNHLVRASFEQEIKRLYDKKDSRVTFNEYRWARELSRRATTAAQVKKFIREGNR